LRALRPFSKNEPFRPPERASYKKWLRYILDFCARYPVPEARSDQVRLFIDELREKKQTPSQQDQAAHAVSLYYKIQRKGEIQAADCHASPGSESWTEGKTSSVQVPRQVRERSPSLPQTIALPERSPGQAKTRSFVSPPQRQPWRRWENGHVVASASPEWDAVIAELAAEIKTLHYSRKALETYAHWSRRSQRFLQDKAPESPSAKTSRNPRPVWRCNAASRHPRRIRR
jgi:hypothetical protein